VHQSIASKHLFAAVFFANSPTNSAKDQVILPPHGIFTWIIRENCMRFCWSDWAVLPLLLCSNRASGKTTLAGTVVDQLAGHAIDLDLERAEDLALLTDPGVFCVRSAANWW
jgi:hypothetical protein